MTDTHKPPSSYILRELHDVAVPESVSWVPQTIGWKILAIVAAILLVYLGYQVVLHWWDNRYRKEAIKAVSGLNPGDSSMPNALFSILKVVLTYLDSNNARLFGPPFLRKLDQLNPKQKRFDDQAAKRWLQSLVDPSSELAHSERLQLLQRANEWLKDHDGNAPDVEEPTLNGKARVIKGGRHG
ncbi:DUF4381 domain-containing protein [Vibrio sp. AND4]|uniref:DUF4381 domain-containing protein n=1 Tax=Vibrio sp. AND4 TaxID=314289 RepID=UPI00015EFF52|nr:DUF4381 domain-containing protein [Vibrio sp. AND4]EDP59337.1 hypothetical protein AND4_09197 [Vibrio sp. AND4]